MPVSPREDETRETASERAAPTTRLAAETVIADRYVVLSTLGAGGSGTVYRARHVATRREVALKVLHPALHEFPRALRRFEREARALADVSHPNINPTLDAGVDPASKCRYQTTALLDGESLRAIVRRDAPMELSRALGLVTPVLSALEAVHAAGIVHRDVKPENIFVTARDGDAHPWLLDFGICKCAEGDTLDAPDGGLVGTPAYMAPEQAAGDLEVDARADVWAAGAVLYELLTGSPPFHDAAPGRLLARILTEDAAPLSTLRPDLPRALAACVDRSLSRDRAARFPSARAFSDALAAGGSDATPTSPRGATADARPRVARRLALVAALAALGAAFARNARRADSPPAVVAARVAPPPTRPPPTVDVDAARPAAVDASAAVDAPAAARARAPTRRREASPQALRPYEIE